MTCRIALNIGSIVCSCVQTQKETILKAVIVDLLNFLNRKSYRHSLIFFVSDHVCHILPHLLSRQHATADKHMSHALILFVFCLSDPDI